MVYLYAGEKDGYTLARAMKEVGGDDRRMIEIDILRERDSSESHDVLKRGGVYSTLLRAALDGLVKAGHYITQLPYQECAATLPVASRRTKTGENLGGALG